MRRLCLPLSIARHDVCIFGGGGIIQDQSSILNLIYFLVQIQYAKLARKTVVLAFVGIGPICSRVGRIWTKMALSEIALCIVRDPGGKQLLDELGVAGTEVVCASDIALSLECHSDIKHSRGTKERYVLLSLRHWYNQSNSMMPASLKSGNVKPGGRLDTFLTRVAQALMKFLERNEGFHVLAVPFFGQRDNLVHEALRSKLEPHFRHRLQLHSVVSDPCEYLRLAGAASCVLGMRLHALILASLKAVPMVALSYSSKVTAFMNQLDLADYVIDIEVEPEADRIADRLDGALRDSAHIRNGIQRQMQELRKSNDVALTRLVKLVEDE